VNKPLLEKRQKKLVKNYVKRVTNFILDLIGKVEHLLEVPALAVHAYLHIYISMGPPIYLGSLLITTLLPGSRQTKTMPNHMAISPSDN
jgi:hypothetical protein